LKYLYALLLLQETEILEEFKKKMHEIYEPSRGTFTVQPLLTSFALAKPVVTETTTASPTKRAFHAVETCPDEEIQVLSSSASKKSKIDSSTDRSQSSFPKTQNPTAEISAVVPIEVTIRESNQMVASSSINPATKTSYQVIFENEPPIPDHNTPEQQIARPRRRKMTESPAPSPQQNLTSHARTPVTCNALGLSGALDWSFKEILTKRQRAGAEENYEQQKRQSRRSRLRIPRSCSANITPDDQANDIAAAALERILKKVGIMFLYDC
jgi:hypothetical protein